MNGLIKKLTDRAQWLIFPYRCPYCGRFIEYNETECSFCTVFQRGRLVRRDLPSGGICIAPFSYSGAVRNAIGEFKFRNNTFAAGSFAKHIVLALGSLTDEIDIVTNVPLSALSLHERGYDQSELIARRAAGLMKKPYLALLEKVLQKAAQHELSGEERIKNAEGCYAAKNEEKIDGSRILLTDDVCTTGSTLSECRRVLMAAGAREVICAAAAIRQGY